MGRQYFARSRSDIWVHFDDIPDDVRDRLWGKHKSKLAFPHGWEAAMEQLKIVIAERLLDET
jgi:hypothetical protein